MPSTITRTLLVLFLLVTISPLAQADDAGPTEIIPAQLLILGPMPAPPVVQEAEFPRGQHQDVMEIVPAKAMPDLEQVISLYPGHELRWEKRKCGAEGNLDTAAEGIYWLTAVLQVPQRMEVEFVLTAGTALFVDGLEVTGSRADGAYTASHVLRAGWYTIQGRSENAVGLMASVDSDQPQPRWTWSSTATLTDFQFLAGQPRASSLAVSDDGKIILRKITRREPALSRLDVLDGKGRLLASDLGGGKARPVGFFPGSHDLLLKKSSSDGTDLLVWQGPAGLMRTVLRGEPGLGLVKMSPDGKFLLLASTAALEVADPPSGNRRFVHLREQVVDFTPEPHLHLLDVATGSRRLLTTPADLVLDDAIFSADGGDIYYVRTVHQVERPWFKSEIVALSLADGNESILASFTGGWEVRPQGLAASPDGKRLVFLGPPEEVGAGHGEHNVYNKQVWDLDLKSGSFNRVSIRTQVAFDVGGGMPRFNSKGQLLVEAVEGSRKHLAQLDPKKDWAMELMETKGGSLGSVAISSDGRQLVYTASNPIDPGALYFGRTMGKTAQLENYTSQWSAGWTWSEPQPASFTSDDGVEIEAWLYPPAGAGKGGDPVFGTPPSGKSPLIVYYYAGATPTMQGFNGTHQFYAANGYAVLVINPRGTYGFGDQYADHHAGDWGPVAASDIITGTEKTLGQNPWLDDGAIGIYGGSYGGFMTDYLVTVTDMYAAAVSMYGISDLATYWGQGTWGWTYGDMALAGATPWANPQYFIDHSPLFHADKINTPLLLLHGSEDDNVTPGESQQLFTALSVLNRPVEMVMFPGEGHGISGSWENRVGHRTMILEWFDRYCRGDGVAWTERWE